MFPDFKPSRSSKATPSITSEAVQALVNLGYKKREADTLVRDTIEHYDLRKRIDDGDLTVENLFSMAIMPRAEAKGEQSLAKNPSSANIGSDGGFRSVNESSEIVSDKPSAISETSVFKEVVDRIRKDTGEQPRELAFELEGGIRHRDMEESVLNGTATVDELMALMRTLKRENMKRDKESRPTRLVYFDKETGQPIQDNASRQKREAEYRANTGQSVISGNPISSPTQTESSTDVFPNPPAQSVEPIESSIQEPQSVEPLQPAPRSNQQAPPTNPDNPSGSDRKDNQREPQSIEPPRPTAPTSQPTPAGDGTSVNASVQNQFVTESQTSSPQPQLSPVVESAQPQSAQPAPPTETESIADKGLDAVQTGLDAAGVVDPTPISDGANAAISLGRAVTDPKNAGTHLFNAGVSVVSMIPYIGDLAKGLKYGGKAAKGAAGTKAAGKATSRGEAAAIEGAASKTPSEQFEDIWNKVEQQRGGGGGMGGPINNGLGGSGGSGGSGSGGAPPSGGDDDPNASTPGSSEPVADANVKPITDKALEVAGVFGTVVAAGLSYAKTTEQLNKIVLEYHRHIAGFNGELAQSYGELETGRMQRDMQNAADYGGSVAGLAGSQNDLEAALQDFQSPFTEMGTDIQNGLTQLATLAVQAIDFIEPLSELYPMIKRWFGLKDGDDPKAPGGYFDRLRQKADKMKQKDKI